MNFIKCSQVSILNKSTATIKTLILTHMMKSNHQSKLSNITEVLILVCHVDGHVTYFFVKKNIFLKTLRDLPQNFNFNQL